MSIRDWGYDGPAVLDKGALPARVLGTWGDYYRIVCDKGEGIARKKASAYLKRRGEDNAPYQKRRAEDNATCQDIPTTGDFVALHWNPHGESRILATLPRTSKFERAAAGTAGRRAQTIAVNFDTLFFLMSLNQNFSIRRLERFLSLGRATGAGVVVLLTKSDLLGTDSDGTAPFLADAVACAGDVPVFAISSKTGDGLDQLAPYVIPRRTLAFIGSSGVGKSSLVNALAGEELMPTLEVRDWDSKGRHTTTERELIRLPSGALVIDTPGMREIGMWEADAGITDSFADIASLVAGCRFSDCRHDTEPGCAVKTALASGKLSEERWLAYCRLKSEAAREETTRTESAHRYRK